MTSAAQEKPEVVEEIRGVLDIRNEAFRQKDIDALMATYSDDAVVLGVGEGELWVGKEEIRGAHIEMFKSFDQETAEKKWSKWGLNDSKDTAWSSNLLDVTSTKDGVSYTFHLNLSAVLVKEGDSWRIASIHFSNVIGGDE